MTPFAELEATAPHVIWDGILGRVVQGEQSTLVVVELEPGAVVPEHSHPNEQLGVCAKGSLTFRIGEEERELGPGASWCIRGGVPHAVETGPNGAVVIETFAPAREDWNDLERVPATAPRWP